MKIKMQNTPNDIKTMKTTTLLASLAAAITMTVGTSSAQTYNFTPTVDGHVSSGYGSDFTSSTMGAFAHPWWSGAHALVKFDLSGVTESSAISATLTLNVNSVGDPGNCTIWQLGPTAWTTSATEYTYDGVNSWPNHYGVPPWGYDGQSGSALLPATAVTMNVTGAGSYSWDVTSIVNSWLGGANNSGFMIGTWELVYGAPGWNAPDVYISTMEAAEGVRPLLQINAVPEPSTAALLALGIGAALLGARRRNCHAQI